MTLLEAYHRAVASQMKPAMLAPAIGPVVVAALFWIDIMWWKWAFFMGAIDKPIKTLPYMDSVGDGLIVFCINIVPGVGRGDCGRAAERPAQGGSDQSR